ncbi:MAG: hypothetical protein QM278_09890 [Pseudomonadota bacterium]|nr:hypothetical protein [Pseudomonadota bacterium]
MCGGILSPRELKNRLGPLPGMTMIGEDNDDDSVSPRAKTDSPESVDKEGIIVIRAEATADLTLVHGRQRS